MIYLRLRDKLGEIMAQVAYAEHLSKLYKQPISLYYNGSYKNFKKYYEETLMHCGLFDKYPFVDIYPFEIPVIFDSAENFEEKISERAQQDLDIVIEGDFYYNINVDTQAMKDAFSPSQELVEYMNEHYAPTENTLYIDLTPGDVYSKNEFGVAGIRLSEIFNDLKRKTFDKIILKSDYVDFFETGGFEEIFGVNKITYVGEELDARFAESAKIMFPYMCGSSIISNNLESWWGTALNPYKDKQVDVVFGVGPIKRVEEAPENGVTKELLTRAIDRIFLISSEELTKKAKGEPSVFDNIIFEKENKQK